MAGVNAELRPWLRMSVPRAWRERSLAQAPLQQPLFHSWLLLGRWLPFDRHALRFESISERQFQEDSHSWLQKRWRHARSVRVSASGCQLVDVLEIEPRLAPGWLVRGIVGALFAHRHRRLRQRFGTGRAIDAPG